MNSHQSEVGRDSLLVTAANCGLLELPNCLSVASCRSSLYRSMAGRTVELKKKKSVHFLSPFTTSLCTFSCFHLLVGRWVWLFWWSSFTANSSSLCLFSYSVVRPMTCFFQTTLTAKIIHLSCLSSYYYFFFAVSLENLIFLSHLHLSFVGLVSLCSSFSWLVRLEIFVTKEKYSLVGRGLGNHEGFGRNRSRSRHQWDLPSCRVLLMSKSLALFWLDCSSLCFASNCFCSSVRTQ